MYYLYSVIKSTEVMETHDLNLNYEETLELFVLLSRHISDVSFEYSNYPQLAHRHVMQLHELQSKVVSLLDSFGNES